MATLTADQILNANDIELEKITIPEWGGDAYIRMMSGTERDTWEVYAQGQMTTKGAVNMRAKLASLCLADADGRRLFTDQKVSKLGEKSSAVLDRIYEKCIAVNKLSASDVEALEGN